MGSWMTTRLVEPPQEDKRVGFSVKVETDAIVEIYRPCAHTWGIDVMGLDETIDFSKSVVEAAKLAMWLAEVTGIAPSDCVTRILAKERAVVGSAG